MAAEKPSYWSIDPATWGTWVAVLGTAAASKLAGACMSYFFDGTEPDAFKLTRQARAMFEGERARLDRRRASALNGAKGGRRDSNNNVDKHAEGGRTSKKDARKSQGNLGKDAEKLPRNQGTTTASSSGNTEARLGPTRNRNMNINPQTPAPSVADAGHGGRAGGNVVTAAELEALIACGLGYDSPTAYGPTRRRAEQAAVT